MNDTAVTEPEKTAPRAEKHDFSAVSPLRLLGIFSLMVFCTVLLVAATFTGIKLFNLFHGLETALHPDVLYSDTKIYENMYTYIPQVPVVLFTATILGMSCSTLCAFAYIVTGLAFLPVFGLGGGFDYVLNYGFGYILGFIPASLFVGKITESKTSAAGIFGSAVLGVALIHLFGLFYMLMLACIFREPADYIRDWLFFESFLRLPYDLVFGIASMFFAKFLRKYIWILTAK